MHFCCCLFSSVVFCRALTFVPFPFNSLQEAGLSFAYWTQNSQQYYWRHSKTVELIPLGLVFDSTGEEAVAISITTYHSHIECAAWNNTRIGNEVWYLWMFQYQQFLFSSVFFFVISIHVLCLVCWCHTKSMWPAICNQPTLIFVSRFSCILFHFFFLYLIFNNASGSFVLFYCIYAHICTHWSLCKSTVLCAV